MKFKLFLFSLFLSVSIMKAGIISHCIVAAIASSMTKSSCEESAKKDKKDLKKEIKRLEEEIKKLKEKEKHGNERATKSTD
jgi:peptidoglycan hydrolase CwlO-like protein